MTAETVLERPPKRAVRETYQDIGGVSGLAWGERVYIVALLVAAGADFAAFQQVVQLLMPFTDEWLIYLLVTGLTVVSLTLMHFAGRVMRDLLAGHGSHGWIKLVALIVPWLFLGALAFAVRLMVVDQTRAGRPEAALEQTLSAWMFLALYVGSGVVAAFGAFLTHNPLRTDYRRALRAYSRALKRLTRSQAAYERALHVLEMHERSRDRDAADYRAALDQCLAVAEELKRYASVLVAVQLKRPPVTDGMTQRDWLPLVTPPPPAETATPHAGSPPGDWPPTDSAPTDSSRTDSPRTDSPNGARR